jgi:hypothetical protein
MPIYAPLPTLALPRQEGAYLKDKILAVILSLCLFLPLAVPAGAQTDEREIDAVLTAAETLFTKLKANEYKTVWGLLTEKSKETIAGDTYKNLTKTGGTRSRDEISDDFSQGGPVSELYWQGYLSSFDPDWILRQSAWSMGMLKKDRAEINILYKKSEKPALLKMFKEKGLWKVGLVETFWSRK